MFRAFSTDRPKDCCGSVNWDKAVRLCPKSTDESAIIPWISNKFHPYSAFVKFAKYENIITPEIFYAICNYINKEAKKHPDTPVNCCIMALSITFISIVPLICTLVLIFVSLIYSLLLLFVLEALFIFLLVNECSNKSKTDKENKKARLAVIERTVHELNTQYYLDDDFSIYFVYIPAEKFHYLQIDITLVMGDEKPNRVRYANGIPPSIFQDTQNKKGNVILPIQHNQKMNQNHQRRPQNYAHAQNPQRQMIPPRYPPNVQGQPIRPPNYPQHPQQPMRPPPNYPQQQGQPLRPPNYPQHPQQQRPMMNAHQAQNPQTGNSNIGGGNYHYNPGNN